jgi:hypothetical protein
MKRFLTALVFLVGLLLIGGGSNEPAGIRQARADLTVSELNGFNVINRSLKSFAYLGGCFVGTDLTTYTCSTFNAGGNGLGAADPDRVIYVACSSAAAAGRTVSSVTVAGSSATVVANPASNTNIALVAAIALPTGTTGDVVVTYSGAMVTNGCGVWRGIGYSATATDNFTNQTETAQNLTTAASGIALGAAYDSATSPTFSSGLSTDDTNNPEAARFYAVGSVSGTSSGTISINAAGTGFTSIAAASFAPLP